MVKLIVIVGGPSIAGSLKPLCGETPPPLFPIAGLETIYHQIYAASKIGSIIKEINLVGFYEQSLFSGFMLKVKETLGIPCKYIQEDRECGTGGSIAKNIETIFSDDYQYALVIHCNICSNFPLLEMFEFHKSHKKMATVMSCNFFKAESAANYGNFVKDLKTNELVHHAEKPEHAIGNLVNCGVYFLSKSAKEAFLQARLNRAQKIDELEKSTKNLYIIGNSQELNRDYLSIEKDILMNYAGKNQIFIYQLNPTDFWRKIESSQDVLECSELYLNHYQKNLEIYANSLKNKEIQKNNVLIHESAQIDSSVKIGPNVCIGAGCKIGKGVRIANSLILDGCELKDYCCVINSIVCWGNTIGYWSRVEGSKENGKISLLGVGVTVENEKSIRNCVVLPHLVLIKNHFNEILF